MKSILIIGMGRFGKNLAHHLQGHGNHVMVVDDNDKLIEELAPSFTDSFVGDCTNEAVLRSLGVSKFDICFVTIGENFQSSLEITSLLKELGAKRIVAKANRERQAKFLLQIGADEIIFPEIEYAEKLAKRYNADNIFDFIELNDEYAIYEVPVLPEWVGQTIVQIDVRRKYQVNIIAVKQGERMNITPNPHYKFQDGDHLMVIGEYKQVVQMAPKTQKKSKT